MKSTGWHTLDNTNNGQHNFIVIAAPKYICFSVVQKYSPLLQVRAD